tara:strand:- start:40 stop:216 length:177 start_codon:yes stop_codon:yes gene_type:complete
MWQFLYFWGIVYYMYAFIIHWQKHFHYQLHMLNHNKLGHQFLPPGDYSHKHLDYLHKD